MRKIFISILIILLFSFSHIYAAEKYTIERKITFANNGNKTIDNGTINITIGQKNITGYQVDDDSFLSPAPTEVFNDEFGNVVATYKLNSFIPGRKMEIILRKTGIQTAVSGDIYVRTESTVNDENKEFIKPQPFIESDDKVIISKAKELTDNYSSDYKRAQALFQFVNTSLTYDTNTQYANKGALSALNNRKGVCEDYSCLFAALCRAIDIPCKVICGYSITKEVGKETKKIDDETGEEVIVPGEVTYKTVKHAWNEIWFDDYGWRPVDTCSFLYVNGKATTNWDSFCNIPDSKYFSTHMYHAEFYDIQFSDSLSIDSNSIETYLAGEKTYDSHEFKDLQGYYWAKDYIESMYEQGIINGYDEDNFGPGNNISRIDYICLLARALRAMKYEPKTKSGHVYVFSDYDPNHYSKKDYDFILRAFEDFEPYDKFSVGYLAFTNLFGSSLKPNTPITRGEAVALLAPFLKLASDGDISFSDINGYKYKQQIIKTASNKLINGYTDGTFRPNNYIKRAEAASIFYKYLGATGGTITF